MSYHSSLDVRKLYLFARVAHEFVFGSQHSTCVHTVLMHHGPAVCILLLNVHCYGQELVRGVRSVHF